MDWFEQAIMTTALILLGVAIIFLVYGALTGIFDEKKWYQRQYASSKKRSTNSSHNRIDGKGPIAHTSISETELTVEEKQALQAQNKLLWPDEQHFGEENDSDNNRPPLSRDGTSR